MAGRGRPPTNLEASPRVRLVTIAPRGNASLQAPMMDIHTIAAGGGSIVRYADGRLQVGPASAGADPGPAC